MRLLPVKITPERMEHIQSRPGRGHIKPHEIMEALRDTGRVVMRNKKRGAGDYLVSGKSLDGKSLMVCVKLIDEEPF